MWMAIDIDIISESFLYTYSMNVNAYLTWDHRITACLSLQIHRAIIDVSKRSPVRFWFTT